MIKNPFKLEKLKINVYGKVGRSGSPKDTFEVMFNPESYSLKYENVNHLSYSLIFLHSIPINHLENYCFVHHISFGNLKFVSFSISENISDCVSTLNLKVSL